jgi:hypothetical protein
MAKPSAHRDHAEFEREFETATREGREADRIEPRATAIGYDATRGLVLVELRSGFVFGFPPERIPGLEATSAKQLAAVRLSPSGDGLHWDDLDVQVSLTGLVREALKLDEWAPRVMGQLRSEAKARAARVGLGRAGSSPRCAPLLFPQRHERVGGCRSPGRDAS